MPAKIEFIEGELDLGWKNLPQYNGVAVIGKPPHDEFTPSRNSPHTVFLMEGETLDIDTKGKFIPVTSNVLPTAFPKAVTRIEQRNLDTTLVTPSARRAPTQEVDTPTTFRINSDTKIRVSTIPLGAI